MPCVLKTCSRANVTCVLTCSRANVPCVLTCSRANVLCMLTCSRANVLMWSRANVLVLMPLFSVSLPLSLKFYAVLVRLKSLITVLSLKKREKVPSSKSQTLTKERTCSFWGWIFGWSREGFISSARKESTDADIVRKFFFSVCVWFIPTLLFWIFT